MLNHYDDHLFKTEIGIDTAIINAIEKQMPIRKLLWRSKNVTRFMDLTKEIFQRRRKMLDARPGKK